MSNRLIAHLAHVELLTPNPEESLAFFKDVIGLEVSGAEGQSVYLRGWGEWHYHSLQLTESAEPGVGHIGWRAWSPEDLEKAVANLEAAGAGEGWSDDQHGHGPASATAAPAGTCTRSSGRSTPTCRRRSCAPTTPTARSASSPAASPRG
jgi:catechol 2,3-dioxygenase